MRKTAVIFIAALLFIVLAPVEAPAQPEVSAEAAVLMDMKNGQVLYQKNADRRMYPASTTKILTALIAIKRGNLSDMVQVTHEAAATDGSSVGLQEGEYVKLENLLYAMMLSSANDAAEAVAEHIGGSVKGFVELMNSEARALGAVNSHFANPHGLHDPNHYTTAADLALIAREAMKNNIFRKYAGTYSYHFERNLPRPVNGIPQEDFVNLNRLLWPGSAFEYRGATGVKTGYTDEARRCLVSSAERGGRELLAVVMKTENDGIYKDSIALLDYGFHNFKQVLLVEEGAQAGRAIVKNGLEKEVGAVAAGSFYYNVPVNGSTPVEKKISLDGTVEAPVKKGKKLGAMIFVMGGREIGSVDLVADRDVGREPFFRWWYGAVIMGLLGLFIRARARARRRRYFLYRKRKYYY
ncbi:MAG: D-alanyl-D-alanine carboxypeptidase [Peptococcaceae bacterium]|nr:D-alanyl-D-alanine carboxypeptidase [Peptococcaceae bacterium]